MECRIFDGWQLPDSTVKLLALLKQNVFSEHLEQNLLATDAHKAGDSAAEAQHGAAARHIGLRAARCTIMRRAAATQAEPHGCLGRRCRARQPHRSDLPAYEGGAQA